MTLDLDRLRVRFAQEHGAEARVFSAPGRVNLIGEHTDYNDGFVLPMALEQRTYVAGSARADRRVRVQTLSSGERAEFDLARPGPKKRGSFVDYVEGTAQALLDRGVALSGANLLIDSNLPLGAGLSASAALEVAVGYALMRLSGIEQPDLLKLALAGQSAEHNYVGTLCGIMDQYIVALARRDHALLIDCRSLEPTPVPLELGAACILICDTGVKHELSSSHYNDRRAECRIAARFFAQISPGISALRDVSSELFAAHAADLPPVVRKRARHVVAENERTLEGARALRSGRLDRFGSLMVTSHASLRDDFEVSCPELDAAVEAAMAESGVYGSRMTGGGFGGCAVTLLETAAVERVQLAILARFSRSFSRTPRFFTARASPGVSEIGAP